MEISPAYALAVVEVAWINILLSGDNAVVIALACRSLPDQQRRWGILLGSGAAIVLRIIFAFMVTWLMAVPYLQAMGGALLIWIAVSLTNGQNSDHDVKAHESLWHAVATIAVADAAMSLDNVVAIAAIAGGDYWLFIIGLVLSIPLIVVGATLITELIKRWPVIVWAGAALLGWVAGGMISGDPGLAAYGMPNREASAVIGALLVVGISWWLKRQAGRQLQTGP